MELIISSLSISLLFLVSSLLIGFGSFRFTYKEKYRFISRFPYEITHTTNKRLNSLTIISFCLSGVLFLTFIFLFVNKINDIKDLDFKPLIFLLSSLLTISFVSSVLLLAIKLLDYKNLVFINLIVGIFNISFLIIFLFLSVRFLFHSANFNIIFIILFMVAVFILSFLCFCNFNKKNFVYPRLVKKINQDKEVSLSRPHFIFLAFSNWMNFFACYIFGLLLLLLIITF